MVGVGLVSIGNRGLVAVEVNRVGISISGPG